MTRSIEILSVSVPRCLAAIAVSSAAVFMPKPNPTLIRPRVRRTFTVRVGTSHGEASSIHS